MFIYPPFYPPISVAAARSASTSGVGRGFRNPAGHGDPRVSGIAGRDSDDVVIASIGDMDARIAEFAHLGQLGEKLIDAVGKHGNLAALVQLAYVCVVVLGQQHDTNAAGGRGKQADATESARSLDARRSVEEVAHIVLPQHAERDGVAKATQILEHRQCIPDQSGCKQTLRRKHVHPGSGGVLAISGLARDAEIGERLEQPIHLDGIDVQSSREFAAADRIRRGRQSLQRGDAVDETLVGLCVEFGSHGGHRKKRLAVSG